MPSVGRIVDERANITSVSVGRILSAVVVHGSSWWHPDFPSCFEVHGFVANHVSELTCLAGGSYQHGVSAILHTLVL